MDFAFRIQRIVSILDRIASIVNNQALTPSQGLADNELCNWHLHILYSPLIVIYGGAGKSMTAKVPQFWSSANADPILSRHPNVYAGQHLGADSSTPSKR